MDWPTATSMIGKATGNYVAILHIEYRMKVQNKPIVDGHVDLYASFFSEAESDVLFASLQHEIRWQQDEITLFGKTHAVPRLTALYGNEGLTYRYSNILMHPHPWTETLRTIKDRVEATVNVKFTTVLLNYYRHGQDSMGWHQDNEKELGQNPTIASVSFGETRPFQMKHVTRKDVDKVVLPLTHGSLLVMSGATQHFWKHQIPKTSKTIGPRINLTFRVIK